MTNLSIKQVTQKTLETVKEYVDIQSETMAQYVDARAEAIMAQQLIDYDAVLAFDTNEIAYENGGVATTGSTLNKARLNRLILK